MKISGGPNHGVSSGTKYAHIWGLRSVDFVKVVIVFLPKIFRWCLKSLWRCALDGPSLQESFDVHGVGWKCKVTHLRPAKDEKSVKTLQSPVPHAVATFSKFWGFDTKVSREGSNRSPEPPDGVRLQAWVKTFRTVCSKVADDPWFAPHGPAKFIFRRKFCSWFALFVNNCLILPEKSRKLEMSPQNPNAKWYIRHEVCVRWA